MLAATIIGAVAIVGVLATSATFYALYTGPRKPKLAALIFASAALVGGSPYIALILGASGQAWLRGLIILGLVSFLAGLLIYSVTVLLAKQWTSLFSAIPMAALTAWSFFFLAIFSTGVA